MITERTAKQKIKSTVKNDISWDMDTREKLEKAIKRMIREADDLADMAEKQKKISRIRESNSMRKRTSQFQYNIKGSVSKI